MEKEVAELEAQVAKVTKENEELLAKKSKSENQRSGGNVQEVGTVNMEQFKVSYKMNLVPEEGSYILILDSQLPILSVMM